CVGTVIADAGTSCNSLVSAPKAPVAHLSPSYSSHCPRSVRAQTATTLSLPTLRNGALHVREFARFGPFLSGPMPCVLSVGAPHLTGDTTRLNPLGAWLHVPSRGGLDSDPRGREAPIHRLGKLKDVQ